MNTESQYPYTSGRTGKLSKCAAVPGAVTTGITGYTNVTSGDESALVAAVYERATVSVGIDASSILFQFYEKGVYDDKSCKNTYKDLDHGVAVVGYGVGEPTPPMPTPPPPGPEQCLHLHYEAECKHLAGCHWCYDNKIHYCLNTPCPSGQATPPRAIAVDANPGEEYYLVRNSWGSDWGLSGYIAMSRNKNNQCGIATDAIFVH